MTMKTKIFGTVGALLVTMSATGAVVYADTTTNASTNTTGTNATTANSTTAATARRAYAAEIKTERAQLKALQQQRKEDNEQLRADFQNLKGHHLKKTDPADYQVIASTHNQVLGARAKLYMDDAAIMLDRQSKNWPKLVTDLQTKVTDLQSLLSLKQQQLANVQKAWTDVNAEASSTTGSNA